MKDNEIIPKLKVSGDTIKTTTPGFKRVYRFYDKDSGYALGDVVALSHEEISEESYTLVHPQDNWKRKTISNYIVRELQVPVFIDGKLVYQNRDLREIQKYASLEYQSMYPEVTRIKNPHIYPVDLSIELRDLKNNLIHSFEEEKSND